jgi:hypothetical protein
MLPDRNIRANSAFRQFRLSLELLSFEKSTGLMLSYRASTSSMCLAPSLPLVDAIISA